MNGRLVATTESAAVAKMPSVVDRKHCGNIGRSNSLAWLVNHNDFTSNHWRHSWSAGTRCMLPTCDRPCQATVYALRDRQFVLSWHTAHKRQSDQTAAAAAAAAATTTRRTLAVVAAYTEATPFAAQDSIQCAQQQKFAVRLAKRSRFLLYSASPIEFRYCYRT